MKLTYIFHSGFSIETGRCVLIFDYFMDPAGVIPQILSFNKPVYVFTRVRDKFSMKRVPTALIFPHIQAVPPAYSQKNNMQ